MRPYRLAFGALFFALFSCSKHDNPPAPPPSTTTLTINLRDASTPEGTEIIISESSGKVLLDTLSPFGSTLTATLKTDHTLLDFTTILYDSVGQRYLASTRKGVKIASWINYGGWYTYAAPLPSLPYKSAFVYYKHVPAVSYDRLYFTDFISSSTDWDFSVPGNIGLNYAQFSSNNYLYLLFPHSGLYNFYLPKGVNDTVDLSHMDTAVAFNFSKPAQYTLQPSGLVGIMDTTDYSRSLLLYSGLGMQGLPDIEFPRKYVQKYELFAGGNSSNESVSYFSYGDSVPAYLPFPIAASYNLTSAQPGNFSVQWNNVHPTQYYVVSKAGNLTWNLYASSDSAHLNPQQIVAPLLNGKMLRGKIIPGLTISQFGFDQASGLDYNGNLTNLHDPDMVNKKRISVATAYLKTL